MTIRRRMMVVTVGDVNIGVRSSHHQRHVVCHGWACFLIWHYDDFNTINLSVLTTSQLFTHSFVFRLRCYGCLNSTSMGRGMCCFIERPSNFSNVNLRASLLWWLVSFLIRLFFLKICQAVKTCVEGAWSNNHSWTILSLYPRRCHE